MRHPRVVASVALIAMLAAVAVPGSVGSRGPSLALTTDPDLFQRIEVAGAVQATETTIQPLDPAARSDGALEAGTTLIEPAPAVASDVVKPDLRQPQPKAGTLVKPTPTPKPKVGTAPAQPKGSWRYDPEISWYGPGLYGNGTACGQKYTKTILGVAHRSLPCGTKVTFRNPKNGKVITVPVIDRGPYVAGRIWDLSRAACVALDHCYTGPIQWRFASR